MFKETAGAATDSADAPSLHEVGKAERRARILAAARALMGRRGYAGLNMRELAARAQVSVPTLYNLFGSKHAILAAQLGETFARVARAVAALGPEGDFIDRALAVYETGLVEFLEAPGYYRELMTVFMTDPETAALRRTADQQYVTAMTANLADAQARGQLVAWIDPELLARQLYADYMAAFLAWAMGDLDDDGLRAATVFGLCTTLLGVARGNAVARLEKRARAAQQAFRR